MRNRSVNFYTFPVVIVIVYYLSNNPYLCTIYSCTFSQTKSVCIFCSDLLLLQKSSVVDRSCARVQIWVINKFTSKVTAKCYTIHIFMNCKIVENWRCVQAYLNQQTLSPSSGFSFIHIKNRSKLKVLNNVRVIGNLLLSFLYIAVLHRI